MKKIILIIFLGLIAAGIPLAIVVLSPVYTIVAILGVAFICLIFLRVVKPVWVIAAVFICAPLIDLLRAVYFRNVPFMGIYQELILLLIVVSKLITTRERTIFWRLGLIDFLIALYVIWNLVQVIQSPSILGGLYVWRWYAIGPLIYLVFRLYSFGKYESAVIITSVCIGLVLASIYIFYQYFVLGPENAAQISQSLGFTAFYRIGWRLPGTFSSPLVASASYSIILLFGVSLLAVNRFKWIGLCLIVFGSLAIFFTLSRSGVAIGLVGLVAVLIMNLKKMKYRIMLSLVGILLVVQIAALFPETGQYFSYITNAKLDTSDTDRVNEFKHIITDAITKYPFGIGFSGGGAISIEAFSLFGGDNTYIPDSRYLGGDSVMLATLQTSGFIGMFLLIGIYAVFIHSSIRLLGRDLLDSQRILCLASLGFFLGTFVSLGNLVDVWPLKLYLWSFGAIIMSYQAGVRNAVRTGHSSLVEIPTAS